MALCYLQSFGLEAGLFGLQGIPADLPDQVHNLWKGV
jgi:hypothetical protein